MTFFRYIVRRAGMTFVMLALATPAVLAATLDALDVENVRKEIAALPDAQRQLLRSSPERLQDFVDGLLLDQRIEAYAHASGYADRPEVQAALRRQVRHLLVQGVIQDKLKELEAAAPDFEPLARERYQAERSKFRQGEAIRVAHILLAVDVEKSADEAEKIRQQAQALLERARAGEDFGALAREYSTDKRSAERGGELDDWIGRGRLVRPFEQAAFALQPGELAGPVRTRFGYHVIKLLDKRAARDLSFDEVKDDIIAELKKEYLNQQRGAFIDRFRPAEPLKLDGALIESLFVR